MIPIDMTAEFSSILIGMNVLLLIAGAAIAASAWVSHRASFLSHGAFVLEVRAEADARLAVLNAVDPETLPAERRDEYQYAHRAWSELRRMTEDEVTARRGYAAAAMEDIAADAGVTTLVVQRHFDSKEASYCRVLQRVSELVAQQLRAA
jgi:hypothetical protein